MRSPLKSTRADNSELSTGEISKHLGGGRVRCVALGSTEGLRRGSDCTDTGSPVSKCQLETETLGRVFNMLGETIDGRGRVGTETRRSIHRAAPGIDELSTSD